MAYCLGRGHLSGSVVNVVDDASQSVVLGPDGYAHVEYVIDPLPDGSCPANTFLVDHARTVFDQTVALQYFGWFFGTVIFFYFVGVSIGAVLAPLRRSSKDRL